MRHRNKGKILDRKTTQRQALLRNLATSLVLYEKIQTTNARAKAVAPIVEKYITVGKKGSLHARRQLLQFFYDEHAVDKVISLLSPRFQSRTGGYTRITPIKRRVGDGAEIVQIEFVEKAL